MKLENNRFLALFNDNGAMTSMSLVGDKYEANFILNSENEKWLPNTKQWGLGFLTAGHNHREFMNADSVKLENGILTAKYSVTFTDPRTFCVWDGDREKSRVDRRIILTVTREMKDDGLWETYEYFNDSEKYVILDEVGIYSSFYDVYTLGENILWKRVNQHIWAGGGLSYIEAVRQSGIGPHLGLITVDGDFESFQIDEVNTSNVRGAISLVAHQVRIASQRSVSFRRVVTDFNDRREFEKKILSYTGHPIVDYGMMTVPDGEEIQLRVIEPGKLKYIKLDGIKIEGKNGLYTYKPKQYGEIKGKIVYGDKVTDITYFALRNEKELLLRRADFIVENQRIDDPADPRYGAFVPFNIEKERKMLVSDIEDLYYGIPDRNDSRERYNMGRLLAQLTLKLGTDKYVKYLRDYCAYLEKFIVDAENGDVWDSSYRNEAAKYYANGLTLTDDCSDMRFRSYNYTWIASFYFDMYRITHESHFMEVASTVAMAHLERFPTRSLSCSQSFIDAVREIGRDKLADRIQAEFNRQTDRFAEMDEDYDPGEVSYEQGTVMAVARQMFDAYDITGDKKYIGFGEKQLVRLQAFEGNQPNYLVNCMPIRHWDGFWFGALELWGDTMPHGGAVFSGSTYLADYRCTGNPEMLLHAKKCEYAHLTLIRDDGASWNTHIAPEKVNGRPAGCFDPLANDQDWAYFTFVDDFLTK